MSLECVKVIKARFVQPQALDDVWHRLFAEAHAVRSRAQAPYSNFYVGVAVASEDGHVFSGCNVERASYTQTTHAEQSAIDAMVARRGSGTKISRIAGVSGPARQDIPWPPVQADPGFKAEFQNASSPCGHCLQIIWENCRGDKSVEIAWLLPNGWVSLCTIDDLFPCKFGPDDLGIAFD